MGKSWQKGIWAFLRSCSQWEVKPGCEARLQSPLLRHYALAPLTHVWKAGEGGQHSTLDTVHTTEFWQPSSPLSSNKETEVQKIRERGGSEFISRIFKASGSSIDNKVPVARSYVRRLIKPNWGAEAQGRVVGQDRGDKGSEGGPVGLHYLWASRVSMCLTLSHPVVLAFFPTEQTLPGKVMLLKLHISGTLTQSFKKWIDQEDSLHFSY